MKLYKITTCQKLIDEGIEKETLYWDINRILEEINSDKSSEWQNYTKKDWKEGWTQFCEGIWYSIKQTEEV